MGDKTEPTMLVDSHEEGFAVALLRADGSARMDMAGVIVFNHPLAGSVEISPAGLASNDGSLCFTDDATWTPTMEDHALKAAIRQLVRARSAARTMLTAHLVHSRDAATRRLEEANAGKRFS